MQTGAVAGAGLVLVMTVGVGTVAHELAHAAVLYLFGLECALELTLGRGQRPESKRSRDGARGAGAGAWATVTPKSVSAETSVRALRLSSVAPLLLAAPFLAVLTGLVPDPVGADSLLLTAWTVGWLACAIPSPQDFSVFWHAERAVAEQTANGSTE